MDQTDLGDRLLAFAKVLGDGEEVTTLDFAEQLSLLVFLKLAAEHQELSGQSVLPAGSCWADIADKDGDPLETTYSGMLLSLSALVGPVGAFFARADNRIRQPALLRRVIIELVGSVNWSGLDVEVKGPAFERLLVKGIERGGTAAGKHFTPRTVIQAVVDVMMPGPGDTICDPVCGTGGFLIDAHRYILENNRVLDPDQRQHLRDDALTGADIAQRYQRLATMNLLLHGVGTVADLPAITQVDSLEAQGGCHFSLVLANPVFGSQSSLTGDVIDGQLEKVSLASYRDDFWTSTSNKQLNFVQHIKTILAINGRAAVVVPDNVLFEAGDGEVVRRNLLTECDVHTVLRMPQGVFLTPGTKVNVVFFDRKSASETPWTQETWIYDLRTNKHFTLKQKPLTQADLADFVTCFQAKDRSKRVETERFKCFSYEDLLAIGKVNLDITWLKDDGEIGAAELPDPDVLIAEIVEELLAAASELSEATTPVRLNEVVEPGEGLNS